MGSEIRKNDDQSIPIHMSSNPFSPLAVMKRQCESSLAKVEEEMEEKMHKKLEKITYAVEQKLEKRSNNVIAKIQGLESPQCTFDGTLTQWSEFANELKQ